MFNNIVKKSALLLIPVAVLSLGNCKSLAKLKKFGNKKTAKLVDQSSSLFYALKDAVPESEKFMKDNERAKKLGKKDVKKASKIHSGLKKLAKLRSPKEAKKEVQKLIKKIKGVKVDDPTNAVFAGDIKDLIKDGIWISEGDNWQKVLGNIKDGPTYKSDFEKFLKSKGVNTSKKKKKKK